MKTAEEIEQLAQEIHYEFQNQGLDMNGCFNQYQGYIKGYTQCQEDMADVIKDIYLNAYEDGQNNRFLAKEDFINSLNKQVK